MLSVVSLGIALAVSALALSGATSTERTDAAARIPFNARPVTALPQASGLSPQWHQGAFMEVFVRAYQDSDGDGVGDLRGLIARLDHLQDLGVRGLWLMPITRSADGDHGYATSDYRAVEPAYGSLEDMKTLLREAHRRGIGVIMDYVINHAAHEFPPFAAAVKDASSPYRDWFLWSPEAPRGWFIWDKNPWYHVGSAPWHFKGEAKDLPPAPAGARDFYFGTFGPHMPDFNLRHGPAWEYHADSLRFWMNLGLDGVRLDAVPHMVENGAEAWNDQPESRALTRRLQDLVKQYPDRYTVCEATSSPELYGDASVCGAAFAFGLTPHLVQAARGDQRSVGELARYWRTAPPGMATFLSNHDIFAGRRAWDQFGGDTAAYRLAAATYLLMPGTPFIYYGEEIGLAGLHEHPSAKGASGDLPIRGPMAWNGSAHAGFTAGTPFRAVAPNAATHHVEAQRRDPQSLFNFYRRALGLRNAQPALTQGRWLDGVAQGPVLAFRRGVEGSAEQVLVLINYGTEPHTLALDGLPADLQAQPLWRTAPGARTEATDAPVWSPRSQSVAPQSVQVWKLISRPGLRSAHVHSPQ